MNNCNSVRCAPTDNHLLLLGRIGVAGGFLVPAANGVGAYGIDASRTRSGSR